MSLDYQFLMLFLMAVSTELRPLVCGGWSKTSNIGHLLFVQILLCVFGIFIFELPDYQTAALMIMFGCVGGFAGAMYDCFLKPYVQSTFMQYAYCAHIGFWSGLLCYSIRWLF